MPYCSPAGAGRASGRSRAPSGPSSSFPSSPTRPACRDCRPRRGPGSAHTHLGGVRQGPRRRGSRIAARASAASSRHRARRPQHRSRHRARGRRGLPGGSLRHPRRAPERSPHRRPRGVPRCAAYGGARRGGRRSRHARDSPDPTGDGYGYLRRGKLRENGVYAVEAFVEKPDAATAEKYLRDPPTRGMRASRLRAGALLEAIRQHLPRWTRRSRASLAIRPRSPRHSPGPVHQHRLRRDGEGEAPRARRPRAIGWSDVGSFAALSEVRPLDARGNALSGDALAIDSDGCVILSEGARLVAAVGLHDMCVIDSGDAVLVVTKDRAQDVRKVVDELRARGRTDKT